MKKPFKLPSPAIFLVFCLILTLSGCNAISQAFCEHEFTEATCTESQTCTKCGKTEGDPLGHDWVDATCGDPKTCERCGETEGEPTGDHTWVEATCTEPKTCSVCGTTEGDALGHDWIAATYEEPKTCARCGLTEGEPLELSITEKFPGGVSRVSGDAFTFNQEEFEELFDDALYYTDRGADILVIPDTSAYDESAETKVYYAVDKRANGGTEVESDARFGIQTDENGLVNSIAVYGILDEDSSGYENFVDTMVTAIYVADASYSDGSIEGFEIPAEIGNIFGEMVSYEDDGYAYFSHTQNGIVFMMRVDMSDTATLMIAPMERFE